MDFSSISPPILLASGFSLIVLIVIWAEYRRIFRRLRAREKQMKRRMYELAILRELGDRIGYSLNVEKIVEIISSSLGNLLPYSTVAYMLPRADGRLLFHITLAEPVSKKYIDDVKERMLKSFSALFGKQYGKTDVDETVTGVVTDPTSRQRPQSFFNIPIVINDKPSGIFTVASSDSGLYRTSDEVEILYTIMNQASEAVSKLETVLEVEKGKLNSMVSSMADGVIMVDGRNQLMVANPAASEMLGIDKEKFTIFEVLDALSDHLDLRTKIEESFKKDQLIIEEDIKVNGRDLQILITPVKDDKKQHLGSVVLFHDSTREKELERLRDDFTSMMVHELRSPLTGIRSIATLLKSPKIKKQDKKYQEFVELITTNASSMLDLVGQLLDVAKIESGKFQIFKSPLDLRKIIKQRIDSFSTLANESKIMLEQNVSDDAPETIPGDESKISQVLNNLISNALKFTGEGGKITVSAFYCVKNQGIAASAAEKALSWHGLHEGPKCRLDAVVISVTDNGTGIPAAELSKLFNKFQQLSTSRKSEKKGTGLGLVVVKGVIEAHDGQVGVFSEEGKGTTFFFTLPVSEDAPPRPGNVKYTSSLPDRKSAEKKNNGKSVKIKKGDPNDPN